MRLNECCQLMGGDVRYMRDVPVIVFAEDTQVGGDEADAKRVKTEASSKPGRKAGPEAFDRVVQVVR
jgi:hypothetical protein